MNDTITTILRLVYVVNACLLITLTDRLPNVRPLAQAFVFLGSSAIVGHVVGATHTNASAYIYAAMFAATPAISAWSVLASCKAKVRTSPFVATAVGTWLVAINLPFNEVAVELFRLAIPAWRRDAGIYWFLVWIMWALVALGGILRWGEAPIKVAHVLAGLVAVSLATEAVGVLAWAANPAWYSIAQISDLCLGVVVCTVAAYALWKTRNY